MDEMMDDAALRAERIRASRGKFEAEVSCTGEAGLQGCLIMCDKNPGHQNFISTNNFNIKHLPTGYQDKVVFDYVKATSVVTCRLAVPSISKDRPDYWPHTDNPFPFADYKGMADYQGTSFKLTGTAWVSHVDKYTEEDNKNCECELCHCANTHTPIKTWGKIVLKTACHVVYNDEEARNTKCQFFYDSPETDISTLTLTGFKVVDKDTEEDSCKMMYVTHDMELLNKFYKMWRSWDELHSKVARKYTPEDVECETNDDPNVRKDVCIIVSHPHGCCKQISIGTEAQRYLVNKYDSGEEKVAYRYNTPTCPGSSGAPIISLWRHNRRTGQLCHHPAHSQGSSGNDNYSGAGREWVKESRP